MKDYHEYKKVYIGDSDCAALTLSGFVKDKGLVATILNFNIDSSYHAYIVDENAEIGSHYVLKATFNSWVKIFDDNELVCTLGGDVIEFYRAGDAGCIIRVDNSKQG